MGLQQYQCSSGNSCQQERDQKAMWKALVWVGSTRSFCRVLTAIGELHLQILGSHWRLFSNKMNILRRTLRYQETHIWSREWHIGRYLRTSNQTSRPHDTTHHIFLTILLHLAVGTPACLGFSFFSGCFFLFCFLLISQTQDTECPKDQPFNLSSFLIFSYPLEISYKQL